MVKVVIQEWERQVTNPGVASPDWRKVECQEDGTSRESQV